MAVTGQISIARVGRSVQIFEEETDINDVFDPNASPRLQAGDHVTLYPGDFRPPLRDESITIPSNVFVTILPGALVEYDVINGPLAQRYENIDGEIVNIADLNIADQYTTEAETQSPRVRIYPENSQTGQGITVPFDGYNELDAAAENAESGDTILVFPGTYTPQKNLFVNGVTWRFFEGAIVEYRREFDATVQYPHALFDDSHGVDGESDTGGKDCNVLGEAEFRIGTPNQQPDLGSDSFPSTSFSQVDWQTWQMYSIIGVNSNSSIDFEAKKIRMDSYADAAVKVSGGDEVNIDVGEVEVKSSIEQNYTSGGAFPTTTPLPSFCLLNGTDGTVNSGDISIRADEFTVEAKPSIENTVPFFVGFNDGSGGRNRFIGNVDLSIGETNFEEAQTQSHTIVLESDASPESLIIQDTKMFENSGGIVISGSASGPTIKFVVKETEVSTDNSTNAPLRFDGNGDGFEPNLDNSTFITGSTFNDPFSIRDETLTGTFEIKVYSSCFADKPVDNFAQNLHDELNGIQWTEDVELLS